MIPERDIWASALLLVKRFGEDAALEAAQRADDLLADGDTEGAAVWKAIIRAIKKLQAQAPAEGEPTH